MAEEIIKDPFYADNSYSSKIASERRCAELIVRKVLDLPTSKKVTLGKSYFGAKKLAEANAIVRREFNDDKAALVLNHVVHSRPSCSSCSFHISHFLNGY